MKIWLGILVAALFLFYYFVMPSKKIDPEVNSESNNENAENAEQERSNSKTKKPVKKLVPFSFSSNSNEENDENDTDQSDEQPIPSSVETFEEAFEVCGNDRDCDTEVIEDPYQAYLKVKDHDPNGTKVIKILNWVTKRLDNPKNIESAEKILEEYEPKGQVYYWYSLIVYSESKQYAKGRVLANEYIEKFKERPELIKWGLVGEMYFGLKECDKAIEYFEKALEYGDQSTNNVDSMIGDCQTILDETSE